jgi:hypothetical protein
MWLRIGTTGSLLLYKIIKIRFAQYVDRFLTDLLVTYQGGLSSMELGNLVVRRSALRIVFNDGLCYD